MNIEHLKKNFEKRKGKNNLVYTLGIPATEEQITSTEKRLSVEFHRQVKMFYNYCDGLIVKDPQLEIFPLERIVQANNLLHFGIINNTYNLCFDHHTVNDAGQWDIVNCHDGYIITLTFSSFWSNKIWAWIDKKRAIWKSY